MNWRVVLVGIATFFLASIASAEAVVYRNAEYGFSLKPPPFPAETAFGIGATPVTFQGAAKDGVAPNCNVQIQNVNLTPAQYKELSLNQFNVIGLSMRAEEDRKVSGKEAFFWRYGGAGVEAWDRAHVSLQKGNNAIRLLSGQPMPDIKHMNVLELDRFGSE